MDIVQLLKLWLGALLRHGATAAGTWLLANGFVDQAGEVKFVGAVLLLGSIVWSIVQKYGHAVVLLGVQKITGQASIIGAIDAAKAAAKILVLMLLPALLLLAVARDAVAADLPAKPQASTVSLGAYPELNGAIVGLWTEGGGGPVVASVPGVPGASLTTTTAALGGTLGYLFTPKNSPVSFSVEGDVGVQNFNGNNAGFSVQGPLTFEQRFMVFAPWQSLLAALPSFPNPFSAISPFSFANGVSPVGNALAGIGGGFREADVSTAFAGLQSGKAWKFNPELVFMNVQHLSNGTALRGWVKLDFNNDAKIFGKLPSGDVTTASIGTGVRGGVGAAF